MLFINTINSSVVIGDLDPTTEFTFPVEVGTAGSRSVNAECMVCCI